MISNVIVEICNRTTRHLVAIKDGQEYPIPPGRSHIRLDVLPYAQTQNPVPGTDDGMEFESMIGVVTKDPAPQRDPIDELPEEVLALLPKERLDRASLPPDRQDAQEITFRGVRPQEARMKDITDGIVSPGQAPS